MYRYFLNIAYCGTPYCGWQRQPNGTAVQEVIEKALSTVLRTETAVTGAGRTDAGVHALGMTAHFDTETEITDPARLKNSLNCLLPASIAINDIVSVPNELHARFDAISRRYEYHIVNHKDPFATDRAYRLPQKLDIDAMNRAAAVLFEYTDFTSFSKVHTDVKKNNCTIRYAQWEEKEGRVVFTIEANRFLRNMVRAIVGTLVDVGTHKIDADGVRRIIEARDRCRAGHSVPACGLYFIEAKYEHFKKQAPVNI